MSDELLALQPVPRLEGGYAICSHTRRLLQELIPRFMNIFRNRGWEEGEGRVKNGKREFLYDKPPSGSLLCAPWKLTDGGNAPTRILHTKN